MNNTGTKYVRIMKKPNFEEEKRRVYTMFKIFGTHILTYLLHGAESFLSS